MRSKTLIAGIFTIGLIASAAPLLAAEEDPRAKPVFDATHSVADILTAAKTQGKALIVVLQGGTKYTGKIKSVGPHAVILTGLQGREFFDAFIPLGSILAMEERVRLR
jgi:hypothetical protein